MSDNDELKDELGEDAEPNMDPAPEEDDVEADDPLAVDGDSDGIAIPLSQAKKADSDLIDDDEDLEDDDEDEEGIDLGLDEEESY